MQASRSRGLYELELMSFDCGNGGGTGLHDFFPGAFSMTSPGEHQAQILASGVVLVAAVKSVENRKVGEASRAFISNGQKHRSAKAWRV